MAIIQVNFVSKALCRTVPIQVILPVDKWSVEGQLPEPKKFKTLYLLHGYFGNYTDWISGTRIQRWAEERDLAVVMPSGDNAFYVDRPVARNSYGEFVGKELAEITRRMFPLSDKREDTFIGGISMGGYGAMRNGLKYHDTFGSIISLSSAFHIFENLDAPDPLREYKQTLFGSLEQAAKTDMNPKVLIEQLARRKKEEPTLELPKIYLACGTEDSLITPCREYRELLSAKGFDVTYEEGPGGHDWEFWDTYIKKAVDWLPLGDRTGG